MTNIFKCTECEGWLQFDNNDGDRFKCTTCGHTEDRHSDYITNIIENIHPICPECEGDDIEPNYTERGMDWFCSSCSSWFKQPALDWKQITAVDLEVKL